MESQICALIRSTMAGLGMFTLHRNTITDHKPGLGP